MKMIPILLGVGILIWTTDASAQPPRPRGEGPPPNPIADALDADGDGEITFEEISRATAALKEQDANGDNKLTGDELSGILAPPPPRGGGPRGQRGERGRRGRGPGGEGEGTMAARLMSFDKNKDGKLATDELPERMQRLIKSAGSKERGLLVR